MAISQRPKHKPLGPTFAIACPILWRRKSYDTESSLGTYGRTRIPTSAGHAAQENKNYAIGSASARVKESQNAALAAPTDEAGFQQHLQSTVDNTTAQYQLKGADQDTIDAAVHKSVSDLYVSRLTGLAKTHPFQASDILNKAAADGKIEGDELGRITGIVQTATRTVGARNISDSVRSGSDLTPGSGVVSIAAAKNAIPATSRMAGQLIIKLKDLRCQRPEGTSRAKALGQVSGDA